MAADDKTPQWIRVSTHDMTSSAGRYILGSRTAKEWADYGRWFALMQILAQMPESVIDVSEDARLKSLAYDLSMTAKACGEWLGRLSAAGAIDTECYEQRRVVCVPDILTAVSAYQTKVNVNRRNGARGGRPKAKTETQSVSDEQPK